MTTNQLRTFLDAHGVPGAPTDAGWCVIERWCDYTGKRVVHVVEFFDDCGTLLVKLAPFGFPPGVASAGIARGWVFPSDVRVRRHAPLPDPTALMAEVEALLGRVEKAEARARVLTNDVDALNRTCIEAQGRENAEADRATKAEADLQRERERGDRLQASVDALRSVVERVKMLPGVQTAAIAALTIAGTLGKDPTHEPG